MMDAHFKRGMAYCKMHKLMLLFQQQLLLTIKVTALLNSPTTQCSTQVWISLQLKETNLQCPRQIKGGAKCVASGTRAHQILRKSKNHAELIIL